MLNDREIEALRAHPDALDIAANWNEIMAIEAGAIGDPFLDCAKTHVARAKELRAEARRIRAELG